MFVALLKIKNKLNFEIKIINGCKFYFSILAKKKLVKKVFNANLLIAKKKNQIERTKNGNINYVIINYNVVFLVL